MPQEPLRVAVLSSSRLWRDRIVALLGDLTDVACTASIATMAQLAELDWIPDALLIDAPDGESLQALLQSDSPALPLVILSDTTDRDSAERPLLAGGIAMLERNPSRRQLQAALRSAVSGLIALSPVHMATLMNLPVNVDTPRGAEWIRPLTPRELQILRMLSDGLANKSIATELQISEHTAKFHVSQILAKLGAESRTEAVTIGIRHGMVMV